jgi:hypothetical protein
MENNRKIDELLSAYIDGQLTERRRTEVRRLLQHDPQIAARLTELEKVRSLLAAVPVAEPPQDLLENVKTRLERRSLVGSDSEDFDDGEGAKQLLWRRAVSIAAIVVLAVALAVVVFTIVSPQPTDNSQIVSENWINEEISVPENVRRHPHKAAANTEPDDAEGPAVAVENQPPLPQHFSGRLELQTPYFTAVDAFVKRALIENGIMLIELPVTETEKGLYNLRCSRTAAAVFLDDMATIWERFDSATFLVHTGEPGRDVVVADVSAQQINEIFAKTGVAESIELAKNIAALNTITRNLPAASLAVGTEVNSLPIPKPVLTSDDTPSPKTPDKTDNNEMVELVIQIKSTE